MINNRTQTTYKCMATINYNVIRNYRIIRYRKQLRPDKAMWLNHADTWFTCRVYVHRSHTLGAYAYICRVHEIDTRKSEFMDGRQQGWNRWFESRRIPNHRCVSVRGEKERGYLKTAKSIPRDESNVNLSGYFVEVSNREEKWRGDE